jgi:hypothetical protein
MFNIAIPIIPIGFIADTFKTDRLCSDRFHTDTFHTDMFCLGTYVNAGIRGKHLDQLSIFHRTSLTAFLWAVFVRSQFLINIL